MKARGTLVALLVPLALSLTACGGDSDSTATDPDASDSSTAIDTASAAPSETSSESSSESASPSEEPQQPQCAEIWVEGKKLPWQYEECYDGDRRVKANGRYCEIGKPLITYRDNWYAAPGGPINHTEGPLAQDPDYQKSVLACGG